MSVDVRCMDTEVCAVLGIDPSVTRSIRIDLKAGHLPIVTVEQVIEDDTADALVTLLRTVHLIELEEPA